MLPQIEDRKQIGKQMFALNDVAVKKRPRKTWVVLTIALIVVATLLASGIYSRVKARTTLNEETARAALPSMRTVRVLSPTPEKTICGFSPAEYRIRFRASSRTARNFMLVFDDGDFSESETVLLSDSMAHLPPEVLSKNFGVGELALKNLPKQELFHSPDRSSRITGGRPESSCRGTWEVTARFRFSHDGNAANEAHKRRRGTHR